MTKRQNKDLTNSQVEKLCLELLQADSEKDVVKILKEYDFWDDSSCWKDLGGTENNFSSAGNQQADPVAALVEKIINTIDALIINRCLEQGIDPESTDAPQSISEAVSLLFNIKSGRLGTLGKSERQKLAKDYTGLVATGSKSKPSITMYDKGSGQLPSQFENTFLSLHASNKIKIHCVQGKFNMGSTGALLFCNDKSLQLIISRRNPAIKEDSPDKNFWGITIIRKEPPSDTMRSSKFTYLAPNQKILSFERQGIPVVPGKYPSAYDKEIDFGSIIKMYEYKIGASVRTNILLDLYNRLNLLMPCMPLPVRLYERREGYKAHSYETTLSGLNIRVEEDRNNNLEPGFPQSGTLTVGEKSLKINIFAFKYHTSDENKKNAKEKYAKNEGVVFTVNGQAHGFLSKSFFARKAVNMSYIKDSILIVIDCSDLTNEMRERLFMNSRDRLRKDDLQSEIERNLEKIVSSNPGLKELKAKRKSDVINEKINDNKPLASILDSVLKNHKTLSSILLKGQRLSNPSLPERKASVKQFEGKRHPTFFNCTKEFSEQTPKKCENERDFRLSFSTDVENQYFTRDIDPGTIEVTCEEFGRLPERTNLWNGTATTTITLDQNMEVGKTYCLTISVLDSTLIESINNRCFINIIDKIEHKPGKKKTRRKPPPKDEPGEDATGNSGLELPNVIPVKKDQWAERDFTQNDALAVVYDDGKYDFYYNADNIHLKSEQKNASDQHVQTIETQYKTALVLLGMSIINELSDLKESNDAQDKNDEDIEDRVKMATRAISPVLLPIIRTLGGLEDNID